MGHVKRRRRTTRCSRRRKRRVGVRSQVGGFTPLHLAAFLLKHRKSKKKVLGKTYKRLDECSQPLL